jgi:hypothetical protein
MTLPVVMTEVEVSEAVNKAANAIEVIREKMESDSTREWLTLALCDHLERSLIEDLQVIEWADAGDNIADAALCRVYAEKRNRHEQPTVAVEFYALRALARGPLQRRRGNLWYDDWRRNIAIALLVYLTADHYGLAPTRNREQRRRRQPSASSIVSDALGRHGINIADKRVENIYGRLRGEVLDYVARSGVPI